MSGEVIQAVQTLTNDLRMHIRSLAEWESTGKIILQTCYQESSQGEASKHTISNL